MAEHTTADVDLVARAWIHTPPCGHGVPATSACPHCCARQVLAALAADAEPAERLRAMLHQISWHADTAASHPDRTVEQLRAELRRIASIADRIAEEGSTDG